MKVLNSYDYFYELKDFWKDLKGKITDMMAHYVKFTEKSGRKVNVNKKDRAKRWSDGEDYNRYIIEELNSFRKNAWKKQITDHFNEKKGLHILDVGTGPGFLACILAEEGHKVTAIDNSEGMLSHAKENALSLGVSPEFLLMDVNVLSFSDDTFDIIVTRNVTWTLEYPERVYEEFRRILKPQGMLLIYDANWHLHFYDDELMKKVRQREQDYFEKYGRREVVCEDDKEYFDSAPLTRIFRPIWDIGILKDKMGMKVSVQEDIGQYLYEQWEKELYGESPLFEICAVKQNEK